MEMYNYNASKARLERLSRSFGLGGLIFSAFSNAFPFIGIGFCCLALIFALLSRGFGRKLSREAVSGLLTAVAGIVLSFSILGYNTYKLINDDAYRNETLEIFDTMYGETYEEMYGINMKEYINELITGAGTNE